MSQGAPWWESGTPIPPKPDHEPKASIPGLADWSTRASATLIEISVAAGIETAYQLALGMAKPVFALVQVIALFLRFDLRGVFLVLDWALALAFFLWQWALRGNTGQSLGQKLMGIMTVDEDTGAPIGAGRSILRSALHVVDIAPVFFGYVRPVFQYRRQTFADQISRSVVVKAEVFRKGKESHV
jgi:uncharacterized RDD family membrane protein YckC